MNNDLRKLALYIIISIVLIGLLMLAYIYYKQVNSDVMQAQEAFELVEDADNQSSKQRVQSNSGTSGHQINLVQLLDFTMQKLNERKRLIGEGDEKPCDQVYSLHAELDDIKTFSDDFTPNFPTPEGIVQIKADLLTVCDNSRMQITQDSLINLFDIIQSNLENYKQKVITSTEALE